MATRAEHLARIQQLWLELQAIHWTRIRTPEYQRLVEQIRAAVEAMKAADE